jgi:hypothetical protein
VEDRSTPFKNSFGVLRLKKLFWEWCAPEEKHLAMYVLADEDRHGLPSLKKLYLQSNDLTEYDFALAYLDSWEHWERLCACSWFEDYLVSWRKELALKFKAAAIKRLQAEAVGDGRHSFSANKWIIDHGFAGEAIKGVGKKGRPTKEDLHQHIAKEDLEDDYNRILSIGVDALKTETMN